MYCTNQDYSPLQKISNQVWVLKSMNIWKNWITKYIGGLLEHRKLFREGFGTMGPAVKELEFLAYSHGLQFTMETSIDFLIKTHDLSLPFWPCGHQCCLLTMTLWVQIPTYFQIKLFSLFW